MFAELQDIPLFFHGIVQCCQSGSVEDFFIVELVYCLGLIACHADQVRFGEFLGFSCFFWQCRIVGASLRAVGSSGWSL